MRPKRSPLLRPRCYYYHDEREAAAYRHLEKIKNQEQVWRHVACCFGRVATDLGVGTVFEFVRNYDGSPAPTLDAVARESLPQAAIDEFRRFLHNPNLPPLRNCSPPNLCCAEIAPGRRRLVIVDGLVRPKLMEQAMLFFKVPALMMNKRAQINLENFERCLADFLDSENKETKGADKK